MTKLWDYLDTQAQNLPVPKSHENSIVDIFCNDCFKVSSVEDGSIDCANLQIIPFVLFMTCIY